MTEVLTQWDIDQLLTAINAGDSSELGFDHLESFEKYIRSRNHLPEFIVRIAVLFFFHLSLLPMGLL